MPGTRRSHGWSAQSTAICRGVRPQRLWSAAYAASSRTPTIAATEATLTTVPPPHRWIAGIAARHAEHTLDVDRHREVPVGVVRVDDTSGRTGDRRRRCSHRCAGRRSARPPRRSTASATTSPSTAWPTCRKRPRLPCARQRRRRDRRRAPQHLRAKSSEIALPMPDPPPVTTATLPARAAPATPTEAAYNERSFVKVPSRGSACERSLLSVSGSDVVIYGVAPRVAAALLVVSIVIILPITLLGALFVEIGPEFGLERRSSACSSPSSSASASSSPRRRGSSASAVARHVHSPCPPCSPPPPAPASPRWPAPESGSSVARRRRTRQRDQSAGRRSSWRRRSRRRGRVSPSA